VKLDLDGKLVLAGAGKMGGALLSGLLARGLDPRLVTVQDPNPAPEVSATLSQHGIRAAAKVGPLDAPASVILVAVKPQVMDRVLPELAPLAGPDTLLISIAAGRTIASIAAHFPKSAAVVRAMPNTPASVGRGITVCVANEFVTPAQRRLCEELMSAVGEVAWLGDETQMDAVTAVSGSGPAYVFLLAETLAAAGRAAGLDANLAHRLAVATVSGAGELMHQSGTDPRILRENVTSPGGTTAAALSVLMAGDGLESLLEKAVAAGTGRSRELAKVS
jgi:pyrroline-5-carboxylate reductase